MDILFWILFVLLAAPAVFLGSIEYGRLIGRLIARSFLRDRGRGEMLVECPNCWRRLSGGYRLPTPGEQTDSAVGELDALFRRSPGAPPTLDKTCRCGARVVVVMGWESPRIEPIRIPPPPPRLIRHAIFGWLGDYGKIYVDCPTCCRRLSADLDPTLAGDSKIEFTCTCGTKSVVDPELVRKHLPKISVQCVRCGARRGPLSRMALDAEGWRYKSAWLCPDHAKEESEEGHGN